MLLAFVCWLLLLSGLRYSSGFRLRPRIFAGRVKMSTSESSYDYDLIVIGGGSGGMSCAKQAASLGARVALFDYVKPSTQGTTWGIGGTCVNVGCVPKKIMHYAGLLGQSVKDANALGWNVGGVKHDWEKLREEAMNHVHMLNFRYRNGLRSKSVNYINALARFGDDSHTILFEEKGGKPKQLTARHVVIAVGGRPVVPSDVPGAVEHAITSDDIFSMDRPPGKTLCVGGSYIALEVAGFLTELGNDVTVAARSILLRGFDRQCAEKIKTTMDEIGTRILMETQVLSIQKAANGKLRAVLLGADGQERLETFDTIFYATGRSPDINGLNLTKVGVQYDSRTGKILVDDCERTSQENVFAIGDVCHGKQELTPVAVKAGELLAKRLFGASHKKMDYDMVPTTVFTPAEYGTVGLTEEQAIAKYGIEDVEVYLSEFSTLEISAVHRTKTHNNASTNDDDKSFDNEMGPNCLSKLIVVKSMNEKVVGFHFVGPNAGEITQGFALAVKMGATKADFDDLVGIHPTDAESFCALSVTKRSGESYSSQGCGGGVCG